MPEAANRAVIVFVSKHPTMIKNSPIKLLVEGNPILPNEKIIKQTENIGIVLIVPL